jgi:hypothetical protein
MRVILRSVYGSRRLAAFLGAMSGLSRGANIAIAQQFPWAKYRSFVDVRDRARRSGGADREGERHLGDRLRPGSGGAGLRELHRGARLGTGCASWGGISSTTTSRRRMSS